MRGAQFDADSGAEKTNNHLYPSDCSVIAATAYRVHDTTLTFVAIKPVLPQLYCF